MHVGPFVSQIFIRSQQTIKTTSLPFPLSTSKILSEQPFESHRKVANRKITIFNWRDDHVSVIWHDHRRHYFPFSQLLNYGLDRVEHLGVCEYWPPTLDAQRYKINNLFIMREENL